MLDYVVRSSYAKWAVKRVLSIGPKVRNIILRTILSDESPTMEINNTKRVSHGKPVNSTTKNNAYAPLKKSSSGRGQSGLLHIVVKKGYSKFRFTVTSIVVS